MDTFDLRLWAGFEGAGGCIEKPAMIDQIVIDSRRIDSKNALFVALKGEREDGHHYIHQAMQAGAKFALVSRQWHFSHSENLSIILLKVDNPIQAFQDIAKTYRLQLPTKIIGLTGSFGKTMVKDLLYDFLKTKNQVAVSPESFNSQIGVPLSLLTLTKQHEIAVIEAAISRQDEMDALIDMIRPDYTILAPVGNKHLATLQDISILTKEILKFIKATPPQGWVLLPSDVKIDSYHSLFTCPSFFWNEHQNSLPHALLLTSKSAALYQILFPDGMKYQGRIKTGHSYFLNLLNMAIKAAWLMGVSSSQMISILDNYQPEPTRTEIWKSSLGTTFINDTYCSDPQSIDRTLHHFDSVSSEIRKFFVFGGMRSQSFVSSTDYRRIGKALAKSNLRQLLLVGSQPFKPLIEEVEKNSHETEILAFQNYEEIFSYLQTHLKGQELVIFKGEKKISLDKLTEIFNDSSANNQCVVNLAAIQANLALIRSKLPKETRMMVIVKALAYGTDDIRMAKVLEKCGVDILGVSYVDEGIVLRRSGVKSAIFSINAAPYELEKVVKWDLEIGVSDTQLIEALAKEAAKKHKKIKVHLHVNTGMGRFGCRPEEALEIAKQILSFPGLELEGLMTHFACAEDPKEDEFTKQQICCFDTVIEELKSHQIPLKWIHAANSSATLRFHLPQYNMVRIGLAVYGLYVSDAAKKALDLRLALSLTSRIVGINICKKGETISYGRRYHVSRETQKIAVLPIGYFDGMHRNYSGKAYVLIKGQKAPMVGSICMDYMMVDVTEISDVSVGDKVLIFGEDEYGDYLSPEELAMSGDSIVHELITCLGPRIQRIFVYEEGKQIR